MRKKIVMLLALLMSLSMLTIGCGGGSGATADSSSYTEEAAYDAGGGFDSKMSSFYAEDNEASDYESEDTGEDEPSEFDEDGTYTKERKIVYTSSIGIESKKFDDDIDAIKKLVQSSGGYYESSSISGAAEYGGRYANYTARIPAENYQTFMESIGTIGSVTSSEENVDDITSQYVDVQARLKSLRTKLTRLEELEANAETVEDLLAIEDRINNVQYDLENYTAQLRLLDDKVDYCTVTIYVNEVSTYTEVKADTFWNRVVEAFGGSFSGFIAFIQLLIIGFIYIFPYLLVVAVVILIILYATRKKRAENRIKREALKSLEKSRTDKEQKSAGYDGPVYENEKKND